MAGLTWMLVCACLAQPAARQDEFAEDAARLVPALALGPGRSVADIGAGDGQLTVALAHGVGPEGRVYATEMTDERIEKIRDTAEDARLGNVTALRAHAARTNLPPGCCDALVIRLVYHHFADPATMNRSLFETVRPGGRVAVIDFQPREGRTAAPGSRADGDSHGVDPATVIREMTAAGFEQVLVEAPDENRRFLIVMTRPDVAH